MSASYRDAIVLAGSGRSGTTWLGNIIAASPTVGILFEPFDRRRVPDAALFPLRPYARPDGHYAAWEPVVGQILRGEIRNEWINREGKSWWERKRLIKEIRANLMLGWLSEKFDPRVVFTIRHPCAVVLSRMKLQWDTHLDCFLEQPELVEDYLEPYLDIIEGAETAVEKHAVMWCVENLVPLKQLPLYDWVFCTYEQLCTDPEAESRRILLKLGLRNSIFSRRAIRRVSTVTRAGSWINSNRNPIMEWQHELPAQDTRLILDIVAQFGINLYDAQPMPHLDVGQHSIFHQP